MELLLLTDTHIYLIEENTIHRDYPLHGSFISLTELNNIIYVLQRDNIVTVCKHFNKYYNEISNIKLFDRYLVVSIHIGRNSFSKNALFSINSEYEIKEYILDYYGQLAHNHTDISYSLKKRDRFVEAFQREYIWYIVSIYNGKTVIDIYDVEFVYIDSIHIYDTPCISANLLGNNIIISTDTSIIWYDIIYNKIWQRIDVDYIIQSFTVSEEVLFIVNHNNEVYKIEYLTDIHSKLCMLSEPIHKIYFINNDSRFNISHKFAPLIQSIPKKYVSDLIEYHLHYFKNVKHTKDIPKDFKQRVTNVDCVSNGYVNMSPYIFKKNEEITVVELEKHLNEKESMRHCLEVVEVDQDGKTFLLYIHPHSGNTHFIPDINNHVKYLFSSRVHTSLKYLSVSMNQERKVMHIYEILPNEKEGFMFRSLR